MGQTCQAGFKSSTLRQTCPILRCLLVLQLVHCDRCGLCSSTARARRGICTIKASITACELWRAESQKCVPFGVSGGGIFANQSCYVDLGVQMFNEKGYRSLKTNPKIHPKAASYLILNAPLPIWRHGYLSYKLTVT